MARTLQQETKLSVQVDVTYKGKFPLDQKRIEFIEQQLQRYADSELSETLRQIRFHGET